MWADGGLAITGLQAVIAELGMVAAFNPQPACLRW